MYKVSLSKKTHIILSIGIFFIVLTGLFPPWSYYRDIQYRDVHIKQYGSSTLYTFNFIFTPPPNKYFFFSPDFFVLGKYYQIIQGDSSSKELFPQPKNTENINKNLIETDLLTLASTDYSIDIERLLIIWFLISIIILFIIYVSNIKSNLIEAEKPWEFVLSFLYYFQ